jgi:hypothetical protein
MFLLGSTDYGCGTGSVTLYTSGEHGFIKPCLPRQGLNLYPQEGEFPPLTFAQDTHRVLLAFFTVVMFASIYSTER